uniref:EF-hand domain-containing protein n=1 Tax=Ornithorhynchus anatinus TaxID=9258 RepID=A0A6I8NZK4_ORNAN
LLPSSRPPPDGVLPKRKPCPPSPGPSPHPPHPADDGKLSFAEFQNYFADGILSSEELRELFSGVGQQSPDSLETEKLCGKLLPRLGFEPGSPGGSWREVGAPGPSRPSAPRRRPGFGDGERPGLCPRTPPEPDSSISQPREGARLSGERWTRGSHLGPGPSRRTALGADSQGGNCGDGGWPAAEEAWVAGSQPSVPVWVSAWGSLQLWGHRSIALQLMTWGLWGWTWASVRWEGSRPGLGRLGEVDRGVQLPPPRSLLCRLFLSAPGGVQIRPLGPGGVEHGGPHRHGRHQTGKESGAGSPCWLGGTLQPLLEHWDPPPQVETPSRLPWSSRLPPRSLRLT